MAAQATPESNQGEVRSLFGGAFTCRIPSRYMDISAVRDIPDHQEVMAEEGPTGRSVIVELLQYQADVPDHEAAQFHFNAVAEANGAEGEGQSNIMSVVQLGKEQVAMKEVSSGWWLVGRQLVAKFHDEVSDSHEVELHLALLRLPVHGADLLVTLNDPVGLRHRDGQGSTVGTADREETKRMFENAFGTLQLIDAAIFV